MQHWSCMETTESHKQARRGRASPVQDDGQDRGDAHGDTDEAREPWADEELSCLLRPQAG
jgi:hypothetical protein